jgi:long-chain fatty acid transport protein
MKFRGRGALLGAGVAAIAIVACNTASAGGFAVREQSVEGQGASFAGVAAGTNGLSSMFWNPATIAQHNKQGYISESNATLILPNSRATNGVGFPGASDNSGDIADTNYALASYSVYGLTDDITVGLATTAPFGLLTNADSWAGSPHGDESSIFSINVNPNIAYKFSDMLSVAVGVQGEYMNVDFTSDIPGAGQVFHAKADDIGFGFTVGVLFEPAEGTSIGLGFRSSIDHSLDGDATILDGVPFDGNIRSSIHTPETVTLGIRQQVNDNLRVMAGVEWMNWSRFDDLKIVDDDTGATLALAPEEWKDSWFFSLGAEYAIDDNWMVRGGVAYETSPVPNSTRTPRLPDNDRYWLSAGASYKVADWITANLAYSHVFMEDGKVDLTAPTPLTANFHQHIDMVSAGVTLDW